MPTNTATRWIHLDHADDAEVMVHLESGDMFTLPLKAAIDACGSVENVQRFGKQLEILLARLAAWIGQHEDDVQEAYVTFRDAGLLFLVVRKTRKLNEALENSLTDVDIEIAQDENLCLIKLSVLALPQTTEENVRSFLSSKITFRYQHAQ
jgi:hypothetical protein